MHVEVFVQMIDQFENSGLIELRWLRKEPHSHDPFEFFVGIKLLMPEKLLHRSKQMEIGGYQVRGLGKR